MSGPIQSETGTSMLCACCDDPIEFDASVMARHDDDLGYVCKECQWRIKIAEAHLSGNGMMTCERRN